MDFKQEVKAVQSRIDAILARGIPCYAVVHCGNGKYEPIMNELKVPEPNLDNFDGWNIGIDCKSFDIVLRPFKESHRSIPWMMYRWEFVGELPPIRTSKL